VGGVVIKIVESFFGAGDEKPHQINFNTEEAWINCSHDCFIKKNISESDLNNLVELYSKGSIMGVIEGYFALSCEGLIFQHA